MNVRATAERIAPVLLGIPGVKWVALFGSVARDEPEPSDIDLFVGTGTYAPHQVLDDIEDNWGRYLYPFGCEEALEALKDLHVLPKHVLPKIEVITGGIGGIDVNIILMTAEPDEDFYMRFEIANYDRLFLAKTAKDFQIFDKERGKFVSAEAPWAPFIFPLQGIGPDGRPHWGDDQVRTPDGIVCGNILKMLPHLFRCDASTIVVLCEPYEDRRGRLRFDYLIIDGALKGWVGRISLANRGVVPLEVTLGWAKSAHLRRTHRRRLTEEEVQVIEAQIMRRY